MIWAACIHCAHSIPNFLHISCTLHTPQLATVWVELGWRRMLHNHASNEAKDPMFAPYQKDGIPAHYKVLQYYDTPEISMRHMFGSMHDQALR